MTDVKVWDITLREVVPPPPPPDGLPWGTIATVGIAIGGVVLFLGAFKKGGR